MSAYYGDPESERVFIYDNKDAAEYIRADLVPQWLPIETAPKDGTCVLACAVIDGIVMARTSRWVTTSIGKYNPMGGYWTCPNMGSVIGEFTHWQPLPTPPPST